MNKSELIEVIATAIGMTKVDAGRALDTITSTVTNVLKKGEEVSLPGFGSFCTSVRAARKGRNPQSGEIIQIKASRVAKFKPGKSLKEAVQN